MKQWGMRNGLFHLGLCRRDAELKKYCRREGRLNFDRQSIDIGSVVSSEPTGLERRNVGFQIIYKETFHQETIYNLTDTPYTRGALAQHHMSCMSTCQQGDGLDRMVQASREGTE